MIDINSSANHEQAVDVRSQQLAGVYAKAFLGAADKSGQTSERISEFDELVALLNQFPEFEKLFASAFIKHEDKVGIFDRVLASRLSSAMLDFLKVLSAHGRLGILREIHRQVHAQHDAKLGKVRVQVTTAMPLSPADSENLIPRLRAMLKGEPMVQWSVDPALIGGVVLRVGDTVYDGSVARQLEQCASR